MFYKKILKLKILYSLILLFFTIILCISAYYKYNDKINNEEILLETIFENRESNIQKTQENKIPILVYHKVGDGFSESNNNHKMSKKYNLSTSIFEEQIKYILGQGYTPLTIQDLIFRQKNNTLPKKPIVITFDDGWKSQYQNALPILKKYNIPATFYIYTGVTGSPKYMNWDELRVLVSFNMEIGSHTKNHPKLTKLQNFKLKEELKESKNILENKLNIKVTDFAYPYGDYNNSVIQALKDYGYTSSRTFSKSIYNDFKDLYTLNALSAPSDLKTFKSILK